MKHAFFYILAGGLLLAATLQPAHTATDAAPLARKTGGAPSRLQNKQQQRYKTTRQNQPDLQLARKVGGYKTRPLHRQHEQYRRAHQA